MSADSYHDILNVHGQAIIMRSEDFINFPQGVSGQSQFTRNKPLTDDISVAKFQRGSTKPFWIENFGGVFDSAEFLQKKIANRLISGDNVFQPLYPSGAPGVAVSRKQDILKNLLDLIPVNRRTFGVNLKHAAAAEDEEIEEIEENQPRKKKRCNEK